MIRRKIANLKKNVSAAGRRYGWKWKLGVAAASAILISGVFLWLALPLPQNYETEIPLIAASYSATPDNIAYDPDFGAKIEIKFRSDQPAQNNLPPFSVEEIFSEAKTRIVFDKTARIIGEFDYDQINNNRLIESIEYKIEDNRLVLEISRKGAYLPAKINVQNDAAAIILEAATNNHPEVSNQKPANDSTVFPMRHTISFEAVLRAPLKTAAIFFQKKPVLGFNAEQIAPNEYRFSFNQDIGIDQEYAVKTAITDQENRTSVNAWNFSGQIPSDAVLGKDRFKYLGWWGQVNANGVAVRQGMAITSEKLGTLSTANRVKVIKEVYGDWVDGKNLWYQIDGGAYAGAYVFSNFVAPMEQPQPATSTIPQEVKIGEKWIDVDLTKKILTLFDYDKPVFATFIAPGRKENPTKTGTYRIWYKLAKAEMQGGPPLHVYRYHLKNIPWTMYYNYDYAIHGTYWHDKFGTQQSAGCTNMTQGDAKFIFENTLPILPEGEKGVFARQSPNSGRGTGTVVFNHE